MSTVLTRYKEKGMPVIKSANATMTAICEHVVKVADPSFTEVVIAALKSSKSIPIEKAGILKWFASFARDHRADFTLPLPSPSGMQDVAKCAIELLGSATPDIRNAAASLLACIHEGCGSEKTIKAMLDELKRTNPKQFKKIDAINGANESKAETGSKSKPNAKPKARSKPKPKSRGVAAARSVSKRQQAPSRYQPSQKRLVRRM